MCKSTLEDLNLATKQLNKLRKNGKRLSGAARGQYLPAKAAILWKID